MHSALLALFDPLGLSWILNPLLGAGAIFVVFLLGRRCMTNTRPCRCLPRRYLLIVLISSSLQSRDEPAGLAVHVVLCPNHPDGLAFGGLAGVF
jgi:hypothetical protein